MYILDVSVHTPNACSSSGWTRAEARRLESSPDLSLLPPRAYTTGSWKQEVSQVSTSGTLLWDEDNVTGILPARPSTHRAVIFSILTLLCNPTSGWFQTIFTSKETAIPLRNHASVSLMLQNSLTYLLSLCTEHFLEMESWVTFSVWFLYTQHFVLFLLWLCIILGVLLWDWVDSSVFWFTSSLMLPSSQPR